MVGLVAEWSASRSRDAHWRRELDVGLAAVSAPVVSHLGDLDSAARVFADRWEALGAEAAGVEVARRTPAPAWVEEARLLLRQWPEVEEVFAVADSRSGKVYAQVRRDWVRSSVLRSESGPPWVRRREAPPRPAFRFTESEGGPRLFWTPESGEDSRFAVGLVLDPRFLRREEGPFDLDLPHYFALLAPGGEVLFARSVGAGAMWPKELAQRVRTMDPARPVDPQAWEAEGRSWWVGWRHDPASGLTAVLAMSPDSQGGPQKSLVLALVIALAALTGSLFINHLVGRVTRPLERLGKAMRRVASGDLRPRIPVRGSDEMVHLARSFNSMVTDLHTTHEAMLTQRVALSDALREAESVERMKDDFLALVSHEVRTPLTTILGGIEFLLEGFRESDSTTEIEFMTMVQQSAQRLGDFMNDAILMANLQSKGGEQGFEEFSLTGLVDMEIARVQKQIEGLELHLAPNFRQTKEVFVEGDWTLFQVAVQKLLDNAWRHNRPQGRIVVDIVDRIEEDSGEDLATHMVGLGRGPRQESHVWRALRIVNTGDCVEAHEIPRLFRRFELSHEIDHHQKGSGLSLPIVASITDYHGGVLEARPRPGEGMAFYLILSMREAEAPRNRVPNQEEGIDDVVRMARELGEVPRDQPVAL